MTFSETVDKFSLTVRFRDKQADRRCLCILQIESAERTGDDSAEVCNHRSTSSVQCSAHLAPPKISQRSEEEQLWRKEEKLLAFKTRKGSNSLHTYCQDV